MKLTQIAYACFSFLLIIFGTAQKIGWLGLAAGNVGYALFFITIVRLSKKQRFLIGTFFFTLIQLVQLSWFLSHPYLYIYGVYFVLALIFGLQFGIIGILNQHYLKNAIWKKEARR